MKKTKKEPPYLTHDSVLGKGYEIIAYRDGDGDYHVLVDCKGFKSQVYWLSHDLRVYKGLSKYTGKKRADIWDIAVKDTVAGKTGGLHVVTRDSELNSVKSAFDWLCFDESDNNFLYFDEVYCHHADLNEFFEFCEECERRRKEDIGIALDDVCDCGKNFKECTASRQNLCAMFWAVQHLKPLHRKA